MVNLDTFYETAKEAYEHRQNVETLKHRTLAKKEETDPYQKQIDELNSSVIQEINWEAVNPLDNPPKEHPRIFIKTAYK